MEALTVGSNKEQVERRSPAPKPRANEAGQSLLEMALLLPILCLLVVGITDLGRAAAVTMMVNNAATAGVEYGSQNGTTASDSNGMQSAATNDTHNNNLPGTLTFPSSPTHGCMCDNGAGVSCVYPVPAPSTCSDILAACSGQVVECVQVVTQMNYGPILYFPGVPTSYQANGRAVMRVRH
ncbi:MAG: TadE/TadG family type IV pilus assembly protein [Candidatus Korobacteraceae bacterium]